MEVYILDSLLRRTQVFDVFESMIWTERYSDVGDFELNIQSTFDTRSQFAPGVRIAINNSYRVMTVETVEDTTDADGKAILKVTGNSLEAIFKDRPAVENLSVGLGGRPTWNITDTPGNIVRTMVYVRCVIGYTSGDDTIGLDKIPYFGVADADSVGGPVNLGAPGDFSISNLDMWQGTTVDDIFPPGTFAEPADEITWRQSVVESLYDGIQKLCSLYDLGFRILRNFDNTELIFNVYTGSDRTTRQTDLPPVVFATNLENLQNTTEFNSIDQTKNVAYVYCDTELYPVSGVAVPVIIVYGDGVDTEVAGFDRRTVSVDASGEVSSDMTDAEFTNALEQAGRQALVQFQTKAYFDGELNQDNNYKYGIDYTIGDLVELRNIDGVVTYKRVTEQIFVSDSEGERSYPTLSMDTFIGLNTWLSYGNKTIVWLDYDAEATAWVDM
jgi:hypothetical protein